MIDYGLSDEQEHLCQIVDDFAHKVVAPVATYYDATATFPYEVVRQIGEMGLFGLPFPEQYGRMGGDYFVLCLAIEELARVDQSVSITLEAACSLGAMPVYRFETETQKQCWLPELNSGRALGASGLTESGADSNAGGTCITAKLEGGAWVINGSKKSITNSGTELTKLVTLTALTCEEVDGRKGMSSILVEIPTPSLTVEPVYDKVGSHASNTHPLSFSGLPAPEEDLLGERNHGCANLLHILDEGRIAIAASALGATQGCVDESIKYANEREAFGRPIARNQAIAFTIAEIVVRSHTRCAYYDAGARMLSDRIFKKEAAIAKLVTSNTAMDNARDATQIHVGCEFMNECPVARHCRDSKILEIVEGTSEVQKTMIARMMGV